MNKSNARGAQARALILATIEKFISRHHYAPSVRDIMRLTQISSTSVVNYHLGVLEQQNKITRQSKTARSVNVNHVPQPHP